MIALAYWCGFFTVPAGVALCFFLAWAFNKSGSYGYECDNCKAAGYRTGRLHDRERFEVEDWLARTWHRRVQARRKKHRIEWQRDFDALSENSLRREYLARSQHRYGVRA